jgi:hypothetical protein
MADKRELARREARTIWMAAAQAAAGELNMVRLREVELAFDRWWSRTTRRSLARDRGKR